MSEHTKDVVTVNIQASQRIRWNVDVTMTRDEWERIKALPDGEIEDEGGELHGRLDSADPTDWDDFEDVEMVVVDADGKPVKPLDEYP